MASDDTLLPQKRRSGRPPKPEPDKKITTREELAFKLYLQVRNDTHGKSREFLMTEAFREADEFLFLCPSQKI